MPPSLPLLKKTITLDEALSQDENILQQLSYPEKRLDFFYYLFQHRAGIEAIVSFHLGVSKDVCKVAGEFSEWVHGSFNACIPVYINGPTKSLKNVFIRFPLPYKAGESQYPGNAEEKLRCEVATYIWMQSNCPDVPIPYLRGFGFSGGQTFTAAANAPLLSRIAWFLRQRVSWLFGCPIPCQYLIRQPPYKLEAGYLIVDCVDEGTMLSESWETQRHDLDRRTNLFRDLSRIILSLNRLPFPRIGSLTIDDRGVIDLINRPLTCELQQLENLDIPTDIPRDQTYSTTDTYFSDLLACHDNRMRYMPNSIHNTSDGQEQLSALTIMRALFPHFTNRNLRHGPFVLTLTDLHQSNIFVDSNWHITAIIDLEWACARPIEMQRPPYWLTSCSLDGLDGEDLVAYSNAHSEFMEAFEMEERSLGKGDIPYTRVMRKGWEIGAYWFFSALDCPDGLYNLYLTHIRPRFTKYEEAGGDFDRIMSAYWSTDTTEFIAAKVREKEEYSSQLRQRFTADVDEVMSGTSV
ncbi:Uncharacterized protein BP5553_07838 [Venustampulla echinocandica]|uniref:Aminoglycoside phosphotransferase domain-containing protein n=1 Tax=Venustampulla echinocandica TaxID=2656787 RepID=A0A370THQ2_9HELO|nr:Uncharacterized protein BP5553_07838 [Venustampulla echinocandica]RDL34710.1 Uncharacterized protein BP5553_07838 [Venustampulla echinocandica]